MSYRAVLVVAAVACLQTLAPESAQTAVRISDLTVGRYEKLELTVPCLYPLDFSDISCDHWAADAIAACSEADIVRGYPDGSYRPSFAVSREQMAVYVSRALAGGDAAVPTGPAAPNFPDVPADCVAYAYVEDAFANNIVFGYQDGLYHPDRTVDRGQMAVFIARGIARPTGEPGLATYLPPYTPTFPDVTPSGPYGACYSHVEYIAEHNLAQGYPDGTYRPAVTVTRDQMAAYVQRGFHLPSGYANPYDPAQIEVTGVFYAPSGATLVVPGCYYQGYQRTRDAAGYEVLTPDGNPIFKLRFAPAELGAYSYEIRVTDAFGSRALETGSFTVVPSGSKGFVRRSASAPRYFQHDSGDPYFAIGENMCWPGDGGTYKYDLWLAKLAAVGGNYIRLWLINEWNELGLEHLSLAPDDGNGLGWYDQEASWRIDYILALAEQLGVKVMMCVDSFNSLATATYGQWDRFPYNAANGGPCETPAEFFTSAEAKRLFKQRLRYLVGRYGYSTSVLSWEFWNEVDITDGYDSAAVAAWHREMADYLRSIDPWQHLITTSYAGTAGDPAVDGLAELDYVQSHNYGSQDVAGRIAEVTHQKLADYGKPHYFGEYGVDIYADENVSDPTGIHLHNGLWAGMMSGGAGTAMLWWWDNYVEPRNLYHHFAPVAAFAAGVNWVSENYQITSPTGLAYAPGHDPGVYAALPIIPPGESWQAGSPYNEPHSFTVYNDGAVDDLSVMTRVQHGLVNHPTWHNPATFVVDYPAAGAFEVIVNGVSGYGGAALVIRLDGSEALSADFADMAPEDTATMHQYDGTYSINVPAGPHTIVVENTGTDWFYVSYRLTDYITAPNLRVLALANPHSALLWAQNIENTWWNGKQGVSPAPVNLSEITLDGFEAGDYLVERWDTASGAVAASQSATCTDGSIVITTPDGLTTDTAYKVRKAEG